MQLGLHGGRSKITMIHTLLSTLHPALRATFPSRAKKRHLQDKESIRWIEAAETASTSLADAAAIVCVGDRENDIYQAFARKPATST